MFCRQIARRPRAAINRRGQNRGPHFLCKRSGAVGGLVIHHQNLLHLTGVQHLDQRRQDAGQKMLGVIGRHHHADGQGLI